MNAGLLPERPIARKTFWILAGILVFALAIRLYHIDFPALGYHNMKENEFISMARNMVKADDYLARQIDFYNGLSPSPSGASIPPVGYFTAWQTALCYKWLGDGYYLVASRGINVFYFLLSLLFMFRIGATLTQTPAIGILATLILSFLPLGNFFSRNLQPESPAFLLMLIAIFYGLQFSRSLNFRFLFYGALAMAAIVLCKLTFLVLLIPLLLIVPYKEKIRKYAWGGALRNTFFALIPLGVILGLCPKEMIFGGLEGRTKLMQFFGMPYWHDFGPRLYSYVFQENFTGFYVGAALGGVVLVFVSKTSPLLRKTVLGWLLGILVYSVVFSDYMNQHNYYQMPFLFVVALCSAYFLWEAALFLNKIFRSQAGSILLVGFLLISLPDVYAATMRQYDYVLFGQDVAGDYLRKHVPEGKPFFHYTWSQGYGVCTYADRRCGWPVDLDDFKRKEKELGIEYLSVYSFPYFQTMSPEIKKYVESNYHMVHMGFTSDGQEGFIPWALILKKGGSLNVEKFLKTRSLRLGKVYPMLKDPVSYLIAEE